MGNTHRGYPRIMESTVRVQCPGCDNEYSTGAPPVPMFPLACPRCGRTVQLTEMRLGPQGAWRTDVPDEDSQGRPWHWVQVFDIEPTAGEIAYVATCSCGWWGPKRGEEHDARADKAGHASRARKNPDIAGRDESDEDMRPSERRWQEALDKLPPSRIRTLLDSQVAEPSTLLEPKPEEIDDSASGSRPETD